MPSAYELGYNEHLLREIPSFSLPEEGNQPFSASALNSLIPDGSLSYKKLNTTFTTDEDLQSENFVSGSAGWIIQGDGTVEFNNGTFRGTLTAASIHIPDIDTTANSFHTNTGGNSWWGATQTNFDLDNTNANAYILSTGSARFADITAVGGTIGGWTLTANRLSAGSGASTVGLDSTVTGGDDVRIFAGGATPTTAPARIFESGNATLNQLEVGGISTIWGKTAPQLSSNLLVNPNAVIYDTRAASFTRTASSSAVNFLTTGWTATYSAGDACTWTLNTSDNPLTATTGNCYEIVGNASATGSDAWWGVDITFQVGDYILGGWIKTLADFVRRSGGGGTTSDGYAAIHIIPLTGTAYSATIGGGAPWVRVVAASQDWIYQEVEFRVTVAGTFRIAQGYGNGNSSGTSRFWGITIKQILSGLVVSIDSLRANSLDATTRFYGNILANPNAQTYDNRTSTSNTRTASTTLADFSNTSWDARYVDGSAGTWAINTTENIIGSNAFETNGNADATGTEMAWTQDITVRPGRYKWGFFMKTGAFTRRSGDGTFNDGYPGLRIEPLTATISSGLLNVSTTTASQDWTWRDGHLYVSVGGTIRVHVGYVNGNSSGPTYFDGIEFAPDLDKEYETYTASGALTQRDAVYLRTDGQVSQTNAGATTTSDRFIGFVVAGQNVANAAVALIQRAGIVTGLSGFTQGSKVYLTDAAGAVGNTPGTNQIEVGFADTTTSVTLTPTSVSTARFFIGASNSSHDFAGAETTSDVTFTPGFRVKAIDGEFWTDVGVGPANMDRQRTSRWVNGSYQGYSWVNPATVPTRITTSFLSHAEGGAGTTTLTVVSITDTTFIIRITAVAGSGFHYWDFAFIAHG